MPAIFICLLLFLSGPSHGEDGQSAAPGQDGVEHDAAINPVLSMDEVDSDIDLEAIDRLLDEIDRMEPAIRDGWSDPADRLDASSGETGIARDYAVVGSYRNLQSAMALQDRLLVPGYDVRIADVMIGGLQHHRVLVGPVPAAGRVALFARLTDQGIELPWMVTRVEPRGTAVESRPGAGDAIQSPAVRPLKVPGGYPGSDSDFNFATLEKAPVRWRDPREVSSSQIHSNRQAGQARE